MPDIDLGTIGASVVLRFNELLAGIATATSAFTAMGAKMEADAAETSEAVEGSFSKMAAGMGGLAALAAAGLAEIVQVGSDMEQTLLHVAANTNMSDAALKQMGDTLTSIAGSSGADFKQLADGYLHITAFGYQAADATKLLTAAMESALPAGADVGAVANTLAATMHEFSIPVADATKAMNELHTAAALGNMTIEQFAEAAGKAHAMAANLGVPLIQVDAAITALTQHGFDASQSVTQVTNVLAHIVSPAKQVRDALAEISKVTGVDLAGAFSIAGLRANGMTGTLKLIDEAADKLGVRASDLAYKLIPAMRGGIGMMALAGTAAEDYKKDLEKLRDMIDGKLNPTEAQMAKQQQTFAGQFADMTAGAKNFAKSIFDDLEPALVKAMKAMRGFGEAFGNMNIATAGALATAATGNVARAPIPADTGVPTDHWGNPVPARASHAAPPPPSKSAMNRLNRFFTGDDDGDGGHKGSTRKAATDTAKALDDLNEKIKQLGDRAYAATHNDFDVQKRDALQQYHEDMGTAGKNPANQQKALDVYTATLNKIKAEQKKALQEQVTEEVDAAKKSSEERLDTETKMIPRFLDLTQRLSEQQKEIWKKAADTTFAIWDGMWAKLAEVEKQRLKDLTTPLRPNKMPDAQPYPGTPPINQRREDAKKAWQQMRDDAQSIFVDALSNGFQNGFRHFFKGILQSFEQLLSQMLAQAVVSGIFKLLGMGASGGSTGLMAMFGFDAGANDSSANRWGRDFGSEFASGSRAAFERSGRASDGHGSNGGGVHITMTGDHSYHNNMDARKVADQIGQHLAFSTQRRLRSVVGS